MRQGVPGVIVAVRRPGTGLQTRAAGLANIAAQRPARAADRFRVGSLTKTFTATIVLQLVAEGRLSLDAPIARWLPGLLPAGNIITVRELLNHTSGLFDYVNDGPQFVEQALANPARHWSLRTLLSFAVDKPLWFAPGTQWRYSNTNYIVLGLLVETVTGRPFGAVLRQRVLRPLHLSATD